MSARLTLDPTLVGRARELAERAAQPVIDLATRHTDSPHGGPREGADRTTRTEPITVVDEEELS